MSTFFDDCLLQWATDMLLDSVHAWRIHAGECYCLGLSGIVHPRPQICLDEISLFNNVVRTLIPVKGEYYGDSNGIEHLGLAMGDHYMVVPVLFNRRAIGLVCCIRKESFCDSVYASFVTQVLQEQFVRSWIANVPSKFLLGSSIERTIQGISCAQGMVMAPIVLLSSLGDFVSHKHSDFVDINQEIKDFEHAVENVQSEMNALKSSMRSYKNIRESDLFRAYSHMLDRHGLLGEVIEYIKEHECFAAEALGKVVEKYCTHYDSMESLYLRSRISDLKDLANHIHRHLSLTTRSQDYPNQFILASESLSPMSLAMVPLEKVVGMVAMRGGKDSHIGILSRSLGVPTVLSLDIQDIHILESGYGLLNADAGMLILNPSRWRCERMRAKQENLCSLEHERLKRAHHYAAETIDHHRIKLFVNLGLGSDVQQALKMAPEGVGLFRTEMAFMHHAHLPSETLQVDLYRQVLKSFSPREVYFRTLDIGGDKSLGYLNWKENNPQLGLRGIRACFEYWPMFAMQLRSLLKASEGYPNMAIMIPMVSHVDEIIKIKALLSELEVDLKKEGFCLSPIRLGLVLEVPIVLYHLDDFACYVDFFSVGSNDLVQYLLAVDRDNDRVAHLYQNLNPAILKVLQKVVLEAKSLGKNIGICGEMAGDPLSALLLVSMGFDSLSMSPVRIARIHDLLSHFRFSELRDLLEAALSCNNSQEVHELMITVLEEYDLGDFIGLYAESASQ